MSLNAEQLIAQLGMSGIFLTGVVVVARAYWQHLEKEIDYLRCRLDEAEKKIQTLTGR